VEKIGILSSVLVESNAFCRIQSFSVEIRPNLQFVHSTVDGAVDLILSIYLRGGKNSDSFQRRKKSGFVINPSGDSILPRCFPTSASGAENFTTFSHQPRISETLINGFRILLFTVPFHRTK
jgi:hypothetical protein